MKAKTGENEFVELRRRAEEKIRRSTRKLRDNLPQDLKTLVYELETHQVELEMQNEELRRARQDLEKSQRQYADLYDFAPTGYFLLDRNGIICSTNFMGVRLLGCDKHSILNLPFSTFVLEDDWELFFGHLRDVFDRQVRQIQELRLRAANLAILNVQLQSIIAEDSASGPVSCRMAVIDITERKQAEVALRELNTILESRVAQRTAELEHRARQLQKLTLELTEAEDRERKRLAEILHDDLQQQLAAAKFHLNLLNGRTRKDPSLQAVIAEIDQILGSAIDESRSLSHELSPAVLHHHDLREALEWLANQVRTKHGLIVHVEARGEVCPRSEAIIIFLFRAAQEMVFNVVKHARTPEATIRIRRQGRRIYLAISDRGRGFDPCELRETTGFGLLSIRERIELLGGRMKIRSAKGRGSQIALVVPDAAPSETGGQRTKDRRQKAADGTEAAEGLPSSIVCPPSSGRTLRVLLADDHEIVREGLASLLREQLNIEVVGKASNGREAINLAYQLQPDIVVMDVAMPLIDGDEATRQIKAHLPQTRVVALSMHEEPETVERMRQAGAESYVLKNAPSEELLAAIRGRP